MRISGECQTDSLANAVEIQIQECGSTREVNFSEVKANAMAAGGGGGPAYFVLHFVQT